MNTLTMSRNLPDQTYSTRQSAPRGKQHTLSVDVTRGYNVTNARVGEVEDSFEAPRSAKRQKLIHPGSESPESSDSTIDHLPPDQVTFGRQFGKNTPSRSQQFGSRSDMQQSMENLDEYRSVEGMMDSNPRNAKRNKATAPPTSSSPLMESLSRNNSVEMVHESEQVATPTTAPIGPRYESTLRKQSAAVQTNGVKDSSHKTSAKEMNSHYFKPRLPTRPTDDDRSLRTTFVATDGRLRGTDYLSSDELDGPATLGEHADVVPLSPRRRQQPPSSKSSTSTVKPAGYPTEEAPMERSNIKRTVFHTQAPSKGQLSRQDTFEDKYLDEEPSWTVAVAAVNLPGQMQMHESADMAIVFDKDTKRYFVKDGGKPLRANNSILGVYPRSLQKCSREKSGRRVRFESAKRGNEDHVLDLVFRSEKDAVDLINKMQDNSTNVKVTDVERLVSSFAYIVELMLTERPSAKMQKMFEVRRNQPKPASASLQGFEDMPEDVQMAARNRQRQEARDLEAHEVSNARRRRSKLINGLTDKTTGENAAAGFISNSALADRPNDLSNRAAAKPINDASSRSGIFDKMRPAHNDHLRRSTRTSDIPSRFLEELEEPKEPKVEKYSVKYGLGDKWSKPLSYPKMGKKKATVEWEDLERLDEGEFLNDNLVSFYMRYLEEELTNKDPDLAKTIYFFNSFFYDRLTTTQKGQKGINYEGVQRWTRGVNLFAYDYVVVPINELTHWYVAIICNLPALDRSMDLSDQASSSPEAPNDQLSRDFKEHVAEESAPEPEEKEARQSFAEMSLDGKPHQRQLSEDSLLGRLNEAKGEDDEMLDALDVTEEGPEPKNSKEEPDDLIEDPDEAPKAPALTKKQKRKSIAPSITKFNPSGPSILTFDSFGHPHSHVIRVLKLYLYEEGKAKRNTEFDVSHIKGITAKNIPQQSNFSDCGLFMLGYVEKFLEDRPRDFIAKIIKREYDDRIDWPKMVPSKMRSSLREQLQRLHEEDRDERRAIAIKAGKVMLGPRDDKADSSSAKAASNLKKEAASKKPLKSDGEEAPMAQKSAAPDAQPIDVQRIRNLRYVRTAITEEERSNLPSKPERSLNAASAIKDASPNASLIVIESHTQPEVASKEEKPEVPSSQPPQPQTPGHNMPGSFPSLPNEIEDSQPSQQLPVVELKAPSLPTRSKSNGDNESPEDLALSPEPPSNQEPSVQDQKKPDQPPRPSMQSTNQSNLQKGDTIGAPTLPKRRGRKGVAQKLQSSEQQGGKKMTKEEAIVLDDD